MKTRAATLFAVLALLGAAVDWVSKELAFRNLVVNHEIACAPEARRECACNPYGRVNEVAVIKGFFYIGHTWNPGIVFGVGQGLGPVFLWISIAAVPVIIAIFWSMKNPGWVMTASLGLILGGTIGNMYDRVRWGAVRDFIKFILPVYGVWPVFNIADSCICIGVFLLTVEMILFDEKKKKDEPAPAPAPAMAAEPAPTADPAPKPPAPAASPTEPHGSNG
jgi:signal peptidase II